MPASGRNGVSGADVTASFINHVLKSKLELIIKCILNLKHKNTIISLYNQYKTTNEFSCAIFSYYIVSQITFLYSCGGLKCWPQVANIDRLLQHLYNDTFGFT